MGPATGRVVFEYAVLRAVPRVDRGEFVNVGVLLYCQQRAFLDAAVRLSPDRLRALDPDVDVQGVEDALAGVQHGCRAEVASTAREGGGLGTVFRWLTAPRSTVVQPGPVHSGLTDDPAAELHRLLDRLVA
ncbi:MAG TPA: DUF3037 domain-containing protein [Nocardioidaceae bacterium]|nr:DUF3037 domain-containing protein [Nocardioidaceae bacterium]